jgi:HEAT repeat protein
MVEIVEGDEDTIVKLRALLVLQQIASPETVPALAAAFEQEALARASAEALAAIGTNDAWAPLLGALTDEELTAQRQAAMAAFELYPDGAVEPLTGQLSHDNPVVRANAAQSLAWLGHEEAALPLRALLEDPDPRVRAQAAFALGELRDTEAVERLEALASEDENEEVRRVAEQAITRAGRAPDGTTVATHAPEESPDTPFERWGLTTTTWLKGLILLLTAALSILVLTANPRRSERAA